jgi:signal transduction histidine kinase
MDTLVDGTTRAGLPTTLTVTGQPEPLAPTADLAAYRIVQESLTNALRHAGPTTAEVTLSYRDGDLVLDVVDRGRGATGNPSSRGGGHGIAGMRERAEAAGGTFEAGPDPAGGFRVHARLPLGGGP